MKTYTLPNLNLVNTDCLVHMAAMPENSVDLIVSDPPYFGVKADDWDNQWPNVEAYLSWIDEMLHQMWRILKPQGSIYIFSGHKYASDIELLMRNRFNVLNHITWAKPSGIFQRMRKESLRSYAPSAERILFAEHYGAEGFAKGSSAYHSKCSELAQSVFAPLIEYFKQAKERANISAAKINKATNTKMSSHWFSYSQWKLPTEKQYKQLQKLFNGHLPRNYTDIKDQQNILNQDYGVLLREYDDLRQEYQNLRRNFSVSKDVQYTDVWNFKPVQYYPGKHPCEKPAEMIDHILLASSREGDVVFDAFMGSGSTPLACQRLNRKFIGCEMDVGYFDEIVKKLRSEP